MLIKLLKYEFKATGRIMLPVYAATIIMGLISSIVFNYRTYINFGENSLFTVSSLIIFTLFFCLITAAVVLSFVISILRFKKNLLDNEGYLMNTLPITTGQNISAKLITAVFYQILSVIVACLAGTVLFVGSTETTIVDIIRGIPHILYYTANHITNRGLLVLLELIVLSLFSLILLNTEMYTAMSIGHSANNHKVIKSVAAYIIIYIIQNIIGTLLILPIVVKNSATNIQGMPASLLLLFIAVDIIYFIIYFIITNYFMKKRLNLQ